MIRKVGLIIGLPLGVVTAILFFPFLLMGLLTAKLAVMDDLTYIDGIAFVGIVILLIVAQIYLLTLLPLDLLPSSF